MAIKFERSLKRIALGTLFGTVGMIGLTAHLAPSAHAQQTVLDAVEDIASRRSGNYYGSRSSFSQIQFLTGIGGFPEHRLNKDAEALGEAYQELMFLQTQTTPTVRVPDLPNPYTTSVQLLPTSQFNSRVIGSELNFEPLPRR
ncbi:MAG: hypothetical protein AAF703_00400 [Cyanobacteria bacterium P01_D01_bin.105]